MNTAWIYVVIGGMLDIAWAIGLKYSDGFTNRTVSAITVVIIIASMYFFTKSMSKLPVGTAYAVFTGIGGAGTAVAGIIFLGEEAGAAKIAFIAILIAGIIGLKLTSTEEAAKKTPPMAKGE